MKPEQIKSSRDAKNNNINIAILTTSYPLHSNSSSGIFISRLVEALPASVQASVVTPSSRQRHHHQTRSPGISLHCFRYAPFSWQILAHEPGGIPAALDNKPWLIGLIPTFLLGMSIACLATSRKSDLIHANWTICGVIGGIVGKLTRKPVVTTLRGQDFNRAASSFTYRILLHGCITLSSYVITVSENMRADLIKRFPKSKDRIINIPNGVDDTFLKVPSLATSSNDSTINILSIGSLTKNKNIDTIIKAISNIHNENIKLTLIGDGPERAALEQLAKECNVGSRVRFKGIQPHSDIPTYFEKADIFILASQSEGRPNVVLEAMAAGVPVIASDIPGNRELITHETTGVLFSVDHVDELGEKLERLIDAPTKRKRLAAAAKESIIQQRLSWEATGMKYLNIYMQALSKSSRTS